METCHSTVTNDPARPRWKRALDIALIIGSLPVVLPVFAAIALWIKMTSKGPIFFKQTRVGVNEEFFTILKFRSMKTGADTGVHENHFQRLKISGTKMTKLDQMGDPRMIPGGGMLRASGLDELPQLINIWRGDMSLVGPRPCTPMELPHYDEGPQRKRFGVMPGLTGLWQVMGKNALTFPQMVRLDNFYHDHKSLGFDLWIIARTPAVIISQVLERQRKKKGSSHADPPCSETGKLKPIE